MKTSAIPKRREDYRAPSFFIDEVNLDIVLHPTKTRVRSELSVRKENLDDDLLILDGENLLLKAVYINGLQITEFKQDKTTLSIDVSSLNDNEFKLVIENQINPKENASLEGLYMAEKSYCTQCEAEGFRKITYFIDRPDILSIYHCSITSPNNTLPFMLSNGNKVEDIMLSDGSRKVTWYDPHKKPCYLFALVAGDFDVLSDTYTTSSGRKVLIELFLEKGRKTQGKHALDSLKKAMRWDEQTFGLEYDLDIYMIVAVDFFNMGAMENKGLNVFNSKYVLAEPSSATDQDYFNIEAIIAHEYFHNWTGNRVTCRDWFQLSLKEGLTVFRDQSFSADMFNPLSTRIDQVKIMKEHQFAEDAGPMSHPIRPDEVIEMNNFYTVTVYDKGAEVIRMLSTLLGKEGFRKGMDLYFNRHDGQAVTCDDFVLAMQDANEVDLTHFKKWYSQSGTPRVSVTKRLGNENILEFEQVNEVTADQAEKSPLYIPINLELIQVDGEHTHNLSSHLVILDKKTTSFSLGENAAGILPVLLSDFSAPVKIVYDYQLSELLIIMQHSISAYSSWDASQQLFTKLVQDKYCEKTIEYDTVVQVLANVIKSNKDQPGTLAEILTLPTVESLILSIDNVDPVKLDESRDQVYCELGNQLFDSIFSAYEEIKLPSYEYSKEQVNLRKLKNALLLFLGAQTNYDVIDVIKKQYINADNMTDKLGAIKAAQLNNLELFEILMSKFEDDYGHDSVVMDKWFAMQANTYRQDAIAQLQLLTAHPHFSIKNPNKVRSLIGTFAFYNTKAFHNKSGDGYRFVAEFLIKLDKLNPQVASRIVTSLIEWQKYDEPRQELIKTQLSKLLGQKDLSRDMFEKISKSLALE